MLLQKKFFQFLVIASVALTFTACDNDDDDPIVPEPEETTLSGTIEEDMRLTADKEWTLSGYVYVAPGVTLTIDAGTVIKSAVDPKGALCIERGGKIIANGTADAPIVFTSGKPAGERAPGDWGGIVILGRATTNRTGSVVIEGGLDRLYGGDDDEDNSGSMKFVRIEYAGVAAFANSEINGLTLGGVGSQTVLENIQVAYGNDDAYEFFGGTVNAKRLVAFATADDDFDFDLGYRGHIQFAVALRDPAFVDGGDAGNGVEADNDGSGSEAEPYTQPKLSNFTWLGPNGAAGTLQNHNYGNRWRRAVRFSVRNSVMMGWKEAGFVVEGDRAAQAYVDGVSEFKNNLVHALKDPFFARDVNPLILTSIQLQAKALADGCDIVTSTNGILKSGFSLTNPDLTLAANSEASGGADFAGMPNFFTNTTYRGAFGSDNWMSGWTRFFARGN